MMQPGKGEGPKADDGINLSQAGLPPASAFRGHERPQFSSRQEALCAHYLQTFVGGWEPIPGVTFQVPLFGQSRCDFRVGMSLVEYHPVILEREMRSKYALKELNRVGRQLQVWANTAVREAIQEELSLRYFIDRRNLLRHSDNQNLQGCDMIHCADADDLYVKVLQRYATEELPTRRDFVIDFDRHSRGKRGRYEH